MPRLTTERLVLETLTGDEVAALLSGDRTGRHWAEDYPTEGDMVVAAVIGEAGQYYAENAVLGVYQVRLASTGDAVGGIGFLSAARDGEADRQPVWLTHLDENPNAAAFLFLADRARSERVGDYKRCFELFDGRDDDAVTQSREQWKAYKAAGHTVAYRRLDFRVARGPLTEPSDVEQRQPGSRVCMDAA